MKLNEWRKRERELIAKNAERLAFDKQDKQVRRPVVEKKRVKRVVLRNDKNVASLAKTVEQKVYDKFKDRPEKYREVVRSLFYRMFKFDNDFRRQVQEKCPGVLDD